MQLLHAWGTSIDDAALEETLVSLLKVCALLMFMMLSLSCDGDGVNDHSIITAIFKYSLYCRKACLQRTEATRSPLLSLSHPTTLWSTR
jgi:hypothetical protein